MLLLTLSLMMPPEPVDFQRDVRPILSNTCFKCHGPATQKAKLRLDSLEYAKTNDAIVPGKPDKSLILEKIISEDEEERMPPAKMAPRLTEKQVAILKAWIASGAEYTPHWAYVLPKKASVPAGRHPIDYFIETRLAKEKLKPSPVADKATLIRRVTLDLIGLLPSPEEIDDFISDNSSDAYEKVVDRLLASVHYGERNARHWLDLARYADSNGYTVDGARSIWPWRDWVINSLNKDMPFDQFTIEQLAGDLLPNATKEQLIATGFHRNTAFNQEGGADPEQFRVERVIDRTNTTAAVWLGLTFGCAQCHDHKYDAIPQKDYYRFYAFFDRCDEPTLTVGGDEALATKINTLQKKEQELEAAGKMDEAAKVQAEIKKTQGRIPSTLIIRERKSPRESYIHLRGDFLRKGEVVTPGLPGAVARSSAAQTRLDLARWLVSAENPLTARVVVNRAWQQYFGYGLVETENDFGLQGRNPTHPELLDWLAVEFRENGWSNKKLHKLIVLSDTYKRTSAARPELIEKDPQNKLLARQNRLRLEAEIIRDAALTASGLLSRKVGGPGVYPPLAHEVLSFTQSKKTWNESKGENRYRRGMYTFIWRQSQHHLLATFDGADAQVSCTRRNRSNTPLQALHLANDPAFVEFFDALGKRIEKEGGEDKLAYAFKLCFARPPSGNERQRLMQYKEQRTWTEVARVMMNLDEFVTRE